MLSPRACAFWLSPVISLGVRSPGLKRRSRSLLRTSMGYSLTCLPRSVSMVTMLILSSSTSRRSRREPWETLSSGTSANFSSTRMGNQ